jgi:hypothetical protein
MIKNLQDFNKNKIVLILLMFLFQLGHSQLLTENFSYTTAGDITTASGGNWTAHSGTSAFPQFTTTGLSYNGYPGSGIGGAVTISSAGTADVNRTFTQQTSGSVYAAFLVNVSSASTTLEQEHQHLLVVFMCEEMLLIIYLLVYQKLLMQLVQYLLDLLIH